MDKIYMQLFTNYFSMGFEDATDRFTFILPTGDKERIKKAAKSERLMPGSFVRTHIMKRVEEMGF